MAGLTFIQGNELFNFSATHCLRNDYVYNECSACIDICPENAFHLVRNKLTLFENECIACGVCLGSCPTEALTMKSFDPNNYVASFTNEKIISCKDDSSCLAAFDAHHFINMALSSEENISCDMAHCSECILNKDQKAETFIRQELAVSNSFLENCQKSILLIEEIQDEDTIEVNKAEVENVSVPSRRIFFTQTMEGSEGSEEEYFSLTEENRKKTTTQVPLKVKKLHEILQKNIALFETTKFEETSPLFFNKKIKFETCTNCGDCTQFCPTGALFNADDKLGIVFTAGICIDCDICEHICKTDAITPSNSYDLVEIAYKRSCELVRFEMVMCVECRCPYPYRGGDPICDRCVSFKNDMPNMFVMAKDI